MRVLPLQAALFLMMALMPASAATELDREMAKCAASENSIERLNCYDELARRRDVAAPSTKTSSKGKWVVQSETSKIDDSTNVFMTLESENEFQGKYGKAQRATLFISCRESRTDVFVILGDHFLADSGGYGSVTVRIDKQKATELSMSESTDHSALGLWGGTGIVFLKKLFDSSTLLTRVTPFSESAITAEFNTSGAVDAIAPLRKACQW